jgi:hypothetical protein
MKEVMKKHLSLKHLVLLLFGLGLFTKVSSTDLPYFGREYVVLLAIQLYLATAYFIVPKLKEKQLNNK